MGVRDPVRQNPLADSISTIGKMPLNRIVFGSACILLAVGAPSASALPGTFVIDQIYSNGDGTIQFVVVHDTGHSDCDAGENRWAGQTLVSTGPAPQKTYVFPQNLPTCKTSDKRVLIASEGFVSLALVTPDYVIPNNFIQIPTGAVYLDDVAGVTYAALPIDGVTALTDTGAPVRNLATNLAGASASVVAPPTAFTPTAGVWWNQTESGSGIGLDYQNGTLIVEVYSYLAGGASQWYLAAGPVTNNKFTATLDKYTGGQCVSCAYKTPGLSGNDGMITITFTSPTTATADLPGGRHIQIERFFQSAPAAGPFIPVAGVWWSKDESGSGLGLDYENGTLIAEVYSYLGGGASQWYLAAGPVTNNVFTATLDKYVNGECISCAYVAPALSGNDGTITVTFTSPTTATADLPGGRHIAIERYFQP